MGLALEGLFIVYNHTGWLLLRLPPLHDTRILSHPVNRAHTFSHLPRTSWCLPHLDFRSGSTRLCSAAADTADKVVDSDYIALRTAAAGESRRIT